MPFRADRWQAVGVLLDDARLEASSVVANNAMNRTRQLAGVNSYAKELGFNPVDRLPPGGAWLDLCCGSGRALLDARSVLPPSVTLVGVDLVDYFDPPRPGVDLVCASVATWTPDRSFDLVTCVHGLHYVGDKLGLLARAASWLTADGLLVADLDLANVVAPRPAAPVLRRAGLPLRRTAAPGLVSRATGGDVAVRVRRG